MKKRWGHLLISLLVFLLAACSSQSEEKSSMDMAQSNESGSIAISEDSTVASEEKSDSDESVDRMVIYKANLRMRVKNFENAQKEMEAKAKKYNGFMIGSTSYRDSNEQVSGSITLRVPQQHFQSFLNDAEGVAEEVLERNVNGQDVTEEYVDLESRLRAKRVVEERLLEFMKNAQKTEDLLKISSDLSVVQEEIEQVMGRMKFLENQSALSTITIDLYEKNVIVPNLEKDDLNTWEKTKKQFVTSTNFLLGAFSAIFVFFIGNLPVFLLLAIFMVIIFYSIKKSSRQKPRESSNREDKNE
ncbi:DUF4349 domain-containing protein [Pseudoneobacillus rhizosphaerae]|uniref:DUF4349 domain-containing protein n=1 Tax=Pseudoneobacillus rhizosphaerae TaxID=2880968 RepID=A0A9C7LB72_9BACI|nr:DUF4349 domain-containing protein [Pseudoneobacillus rhizosphaerae]CAG9608628.1 hypothetical protein NEOCIP111885_02345 [Pseudoneobacillus rhizosphaerae]